EFSIYNARKIQNSQKQNTSPPSVAREIVFSSVEFLTKLHFSEERSSGSLRWEFFGEKIPTRLCQICVIAYR
ncbi:MAG: hypothetical protein P1P64_08365, partial [Treponemataceae bacterium]